MWSWVFDLSVSFGTNPYEGLGRFSRWKWEDSTHILLVGYVTLFWAGVLFIRTVTHFLPLESLPKLMHGSEADIDPSQSAPKGPASGGLTTRLASREKDYKVSKSPE